MKRLLGSHAGVRLSLRASGAWIAATLCACALVPPALAAYPDRPIRIVVPLPAGTAPDLFARHIGQKLNVRLKQPVVIENRPGANSVIGTGVVAKATPDGHTLLYASLQHVMLKPLLGKLPFDPDSDFAPVTTVAVTEMTLIVPASSRHGSVKDLIAAARARPGDLNFATPGIGSPAHLACQAFLSATGTQARHIPMKGSTESVTAVAGAQVDYTITTLSNALPLVNSGRVKALAVTGARRHELVRDVPTMREAAPPGFVFESWSTLFAPAAVPRDVLGTLNREVVSILNETDTRDFIARNGSNPQPRTLAESADFVRRQAQIAVELVKAIGATAQ